MLLKRVTTSLLIAPIVLAAMWFGAPYFTILVALFGVIAVFEFYRLGRLRMTSVLALTGILMTALLIASPHLATVDRADILALGAVISLTSLLGRRSKENAFRDWAWMLAGAVYMGLLLSYLISLRELPFGREWIYIAILANIGADVFAFFVGSTFGRRPLAPSISPKKTWAGLWGGFGGAIIVGMLVYHFMAFPAGFTYAEAALLCVCIGIFAPLGDLVESVLKRNSQTKEAGSILPGHGGFLDRLDSVVFSSAVTYFFLLWSGFAG
jgi:phosphatidate cytidylyltransferase